MLEDLGTAAAATVTSIGPEIIAVGTAIIGIAAVAMGVRWIKATFF